MAKLKDTELEKVEKKYTDLLEEEYRGTLNIKHEGTAYVVPEYSTIEQAIKVYEKYIAEMDEEASDRLVLTCHPDDGLVAVKRGADSIFGNIVGTSHVEYSFFGPQLVPSETRTVSIGYGETMNVPVGHVGIGSGIIKLTMEIGVKVDSRSIRKSSVVVDFSYLKKYQPLVDKIKVAVKLQLKNNSIFKGKAITSDFEFINIDPKVLEKVVYSAEEEVDLEANIFRFIREYQAFTQRGMGGKRTILLKGEYGTGKTLTSLMAAKVAIDNGWTFINVSPGGNIVDVLEHAREKEPALVFFEDIDTVASSERTESVNNILNTVDGNLQKSSQVMVILTTNNAEAITKAMMRPGRIDAVIELGRLDKQACNGLINVYLMDEVDGTLDLDAIVAEAEGYTPAFMVEAIKKSVYYAGPKAKISTQALVNSLRSLRSQYNLMKGDVQHTIPVLDVAFANVFDLKLDEKIDQLKESLMSELSPCALKK
jgi:transitional endoplasmic reticulum ATPase